MLKVRRLLRQVLASLGPAMAAPPATEAVRAAIGAGLALFLCGSMLAWLAADGAPASSGGLVLIAPLGASAFLLFALPNSPLAQPWSAVVGNTVSGLVAVTVLLLGGSGPVAAAEETLATKRVGNLTCADIMSRDLVTVTPATSLTRVAALFREHHFKTLPVVDEHGGIASRTTVYRPCRSMPVRDWWA